MHNYRLPRDRVKGYVSRPLIDVVVQRPLAPCVVTEQPQYNQATHVAKPAVVTRKNAYRAKPNKPKPRMRRLATKKHAVYAATTALVIVAVFSNLINVTAKTSYTPISQAVQPEVSAAASDTGNTDATDSLQHVDETEPPQSKIRDYSVANDLPRFLSIKSIGVYAKVQQLGTDSSNEILTPKNIFNVGWYEGSSKPGEPGAVFINGHVSGPTKKGVFYNLKKLSIGDVIKLETGNAEVIEYKVVHTEQVDADQVNMNKVLRSFDVDKQGLNLMTCGGDFDSKSDSYKKRIIVYAVRI